MGHLLIAAAHKSSGKTTVTLGICAALARLGKRVQAFKKGPDYIDPMWLGRASGRPCYNLDFHTQSHDELRRFFATHTADSDISVTEGNMGLFDSIDVEGENSNAALARLLDIPVVLVVNAQGMNRSIAPLVLGFQHFDPQLRIAGVILNKVAGRRHETKLRAAIERYTDLPVLGVIHRDPALAIDERHLGLVPSNEADEVANKIDYIAAAIERQVDLNALTALATPTTQRAPEDEPPRSHRGRVRIGIARDAAFGFYYPDDLQALRRAGAELVEFDTLRDQTLPEVDGLFIGGGFPETHLDALEANAPLRRALRTAIEAGMPTYAECGGLMYLTRSIEWHGRSREMVGVLPADTRMHRRPVGRGYVCLRPTGSNPWHREEGSGPSEFNAHEFHYSSLENLGGPLTFAYEMLRGTGIDGAHDGIVYKNLLANYSHLRDVDGYHWTRAFVAFVERCRHADSTSTVNEGQSL